MLELEPDGIAAVSLTSGILNPFAGRDITWLLKTQAAEHGSRDFLVWRDLEGGRLVWTYEEFLVGVEALAVALRERGVGRGEHVCMFISNCPEFILMWFALMRIGSVMVSLNARYTASELADALARVRSRFIVTEGALLPIVAGALARVQSTTTGSGPENGAPHVVLADSIGPGVTATDHDMVTRPFVLEDFSSLLSAGRRAAGTLPGAVAPLAVAGVQFTSGTTARPKGVMWTQANYLWGGKVSAAHEQLLGDDRHLVHLPLFHTNAQIYSVMAALWAGATVVLVPRFSVRRFWSVAVEERATWCSMVPFNVKALRRLPVPAHSFRAFGNVAIVPSWDRYFRVTSVAWWGMTETVSHPIVSEPGLPGRALAIGVPASEYEVRVRNDGGKTLEKGVGLLEVRGIRGVSLALGYLDDPDATEATWTDGGWMQTGDRVEVHEDGWITFVERENDMLKVGGENVAALEVEGVIRAVAGVEEVAVVAGPDPMLDEVPVAFVVVSEVEEGAKAALAERIIETCQSELSSFKVPRAVYLIDELPRVTLGKIAKAALRAEARRLGSIDHDAS